jgi:hypothetical protein
LQRQPRQGVRQSNATTRSSPDAEALPPVTSPWNSKFRGRLRTFGLEYIRARETIIAFSFGILVLVACAPNEWREGGGDYK